ncbi:hypothetical protein UYO_0630 [Lachnospiraceae bacterium JC7]|nr:hypothetical protein UYO_0630 [Lachnospiraceae bacterium JC7]
MENKNKKRNIILIVAILVIILLSFGLSAYIRNSSKQGNETETSASVASSENESSESKAKELQVVVQYVDREIFRAPLSKDALYMIKDGVVSEVPEGTTLESMGDEALETKHHINLMQVKDNSVAVIQSNCSNQICVSIGKMTDTDYDFPITCLPHGLIIVVQ